MVCRVACISLRAMGGQDQLQPSGKQCLSPQAVDTLPHLTPAGPSSHFRVSLGLRLTPAEPCSPAETLQPGHSVLGEGGGGRAAGFPFGCKQTLGVSQRLQGC